VKIGLDKYRNILQMCQGKRVRAYCAPKEDFSKRAQSGKGVGIVNEIGRERDIGAALAST